MNETSKILFLFTSEYPFGKSETFIENEIPYLSSKFNKIVIVSNNNNSIEKRKIPDNCVIEHLNYNLPDNKNSFSSLLKKYFWQELFTIIFHYKIKISSLIIKTMLVSLNKIFSFQKPISKIILKYSDLNKDKIFLYSYWANDIALSISYYGKKNNISSFTRAHGWDVYFEVNESKYLPYRKLLFNNISKIFFISHAGENYYKKLLPKYKNKYMVSYLGVNNCSRNNIFKQNNIVRIVSCSNIIKVKRINLIIETLALIPEIKIKWIHFGDGPLKNEIKTLANNKLSKKENIEFQFMGRKTNSEVLNYYQNNNVDLFINVSSSEGIPVSIMEAMSFSIPVIATNVGGTSEIVKTGINGFLLNPNPTPNEISEVITKFYDLSPEQKTNKNNLAYETFNEKFNAEKNYKKFIETIQGI